MSFEIRMILVDKQAALSNAQREQSKAIADEARWAKRYVSSHIREARDAIAVWLRPGVALDVANPLVRRGGL
jgi:hypothetical protein